MSKIQSLGSTKIVSSFDCNFEAMLELFSWQLHKNTIVKQIITKYLGVFIFILIFDCIRFYCYFLFEEHPLLVFLFENSVQRLVNAAKQNPSINPKTVKDPYSSTEDAVHIEIYLEETKSSISSSNNRQPKTFIRESVRPRILNF